MGALEVSATSRRQTGRAGGQAMHRRIGARQHIRPQRGRPAAAADTNTTTPSPPNPS